MTTAASKLDITHAYRHLYRGLLRAVQYSAPARYVVRDQLRAAFRERDAALDREGVKRTVWFLEAAAKERGLEHKILKNLIRVRYRPETRQLQQDAMQHYDMTVAMLNKSMGLCLR
ncbi:uncharacterized protein TRIVIDRAFT_196321 [Trichoderma virens Gv29-8]|uniref:Uncharacterized protein n=1 Tax=Hypocrea virens (strain Gv29-8 / FGSC 10586) TaxID=413071 RepID=G9NCQ1_HYPVG|nr:uncharacterized protein TRIVIDRAFT_196321 [Trichoderma virens Gv29-8]EHK15473.1 hypothetical protein TRIVIDRAFT_196321 [Trichoderma virens Gv29-8]UKZ51419.1 hypothetical protein TrVGV298_005179 [Trichoderma virens]